MRLPDFERVGLPVGGLGYSSEQLHLNAWLVGLDTVDTDLSGRT